MAPAVKYVVTHQRVSQLEGQKQGINRFSSTGAHDILERTPKNTEQWVKIRFSLLYWLTSIDNVFKTCHDAADTEANGKIKERRRSGTRSTPSPTKYMVPEIKSMPTTKATWPIAWDKLQMQISE
jgi:hypothetical protein